MSQATAERPHEIGVRLTVGATREQVLRMALRQAMLRLAIGVVLGLAVAAGFGQLLAGGLLGVSALDPATFLLAPLFLGGVAPAACLLPARRAMSVDPVRALQLE